jgi:hypothetical protein
LAQQLYNMAKLGKTTNLVSLGTGRRICMNLPTQQPPSLCHAWTNTISTLHNVTYIYNFLVRIVLVLNC